MAQAGSRKESVKSAAVIRAAPVPAAIPRRWKTGGTLSPADCPGWSGNPRTRPRTDAHRPNGRHIPPQWLSGRPIGPGSKSPDAVPAAAPVPPGPPVRTPDTGEAEKSTCEPADGNGSSMRTPFPAGTPKSYTSKTATAPVPLSPTFPAHCVRQRDCLSVHCAGRNFVLY